MKNQTLEQLWARKSVRAFEEREISAEDKRLILEAALQAPTAGNQTMFTILDITDQALKDRLAVTCDNQPFIAKGKMVLVFCAEHKRWYDVFRKYQDDVRLPAAGDLFLAMQDTLIAAQNAVVAAESLGIGSCYIGDIMENYEVHRDLLKLPKYAVPTCMLVFGYPTQQQKEREKPERAAMKHVVHENGYRHMDADELREMFSIKALEKSYEDWMQAFCNRKYNSDFSREMTRSVEVYAKDYQK